MKPQPHATYWLLTPTPDAKRHIREGPVAVVVVKVAGVVGKIGLENIQPAIAIVIADGHAHTGLFVTIFAKAQPAITAISVKVPSWLLWNRMLGCESTAT